MTPHRSSAATQILPLEPAGAITAPPGRRIHALDTLRGFALFGILVVNLPFLADVPLAEPVIAGTGDTIASWLVAFGFQAKFFVLFSFLFGYGLSIQLARAEARGEPLGPRHLRRLAGILAFGVLHAVFFFVGDILMLYAVLGLVLWLVRTWSVRSLVRLAVASLALSVVTAWLLGWALVAEGGGGADPTALAEARAAYGGSFLDAAGQRLVDLQQSLPFIALFNGPTALAMFALGLAAGKARIIQDLDIHLPAMRRWLTLAVLVGVGGSLVFATLSTATGDAGDGPAWAGGAVLALGVLTVPALSFAYAYGVFIAERTGRLERVLTPIRSAGRMSLTVYLGQAMVAGALFLGWGLGWLGTWGTAELLLLAPVITAVLCLASHWWLQRFRQGPDEWLLRCWTNLRWHPITR